MKYRVILPSADLAPFVRFYWVLEAEIDAGKCYTHRSMADGCAEMIFHYQSQFLEIKADGNKSPACLSGISGPSQKFSRYSIDRNFGIFGVYLYPFALTQFFGIPASALVNELPSLSELLGQEGKDIEEKIMLAANNQQRIKIISGFLENKLRETDRDHSRISTAVSTIIRKKGDIRLAELAAQYCLSSRQFERQFTQLAGFSPKLYSRITRFQASLSEYGNREKSLTSIAYDCGYFDQSHFIHEFKEFSGFHPKHYFSGKAEGIEWRE